ncbi:MAG: murein biosynthesis integral membrane protein MurJ [Proteobacteria bacterium]|nr:murein biosynthesis integral membrane protein MurJ [Pseudomonadota bacterium]MDA1302218.1 murein biosynthesis integral membrane protein MurJ [Pseudomonadota bacterium]
MTESDSPSKPRGGLLRSSVLVSGLTLVSRIFGLARDMVVAYFFGASAGADAFFLAFRIPNLFRRLFAEGAFAHAFVPVLSEYRSQRSVNAVKDLISHTSGALGACLMLLVVLGVLGAEYVVRLFALGYVYHEQTAKLTLAVEMLRLTFPYLLLISMTAFAGAVLNTYGRFAVPAFTPVLLNVCLIGAAVFISPHLAEPVMALAWGVLIAGVAQLSFQIPFLHRQQLLVRPRVDRSHPGVRQIMWLMLPALFGVSVGQIGLILDTVFASFLETGTLSWLYYSDRLLELPLALIGIAIATVILPGLSADHAAEKPAAFTATLNWALRIVLIVGFPATIALIYLADALIATLFHYGEMTERDVVMAGSSLAAYAVGLLGHMFVKVLAPGYFARKDTATPVRFGVIALSANVLLNLILIWHLRHAGLALATSIAALLNAWLLFGGLRRTDVFAAEPGWFRFIVQLMFAGAVMLCALALVTPSLSTWLAYGMVERFSIMLLICGVGALTYGAALFLAGVRIQQLIR